MTDVLSCLSVSNDLCPVTELQTSPLTQPILSTFLLIAAGVVIG